MSTRKRPRKTTTIAPAPTPLTPEQAQIRDRVKELEAIGVKNHHEFVAKNPASIANGGVWYPSHFLPADLKAEWETLKKQAA
jgi:hypothetical protein